MEAVVKAKAAPGIELREVPVPVPGPGEVLVRVLAASVCGTDLHIFNWDPWAQGRIKPPLIPGHEFSGAVAGVGAGVTAVKEGDFVSAEMHVACGKCLQCRIGQAHICQHVKILGVDASGAFASYVIIPETNIWKLSPTIPRDWCSLLDPLGNAVHTVLAGDIAARTALVTGCGAIGLFSIAVAKACGAAKVFAVEVNAHRRAVAATMGADLVLDPATDKVEEQILEAGRHRRGCAAGDEWASESH
jgi:threonine 3-dehydrogenase